jgi:hypothetical protein
MDLARVSIKFGKLRDFNDALNSIWERYFTKSSGATFLFMKYQNTLLEMNLQELIARAAQPANISHNTGRFINNREAIERREKEPSGVRAHPTRGGGSSSTRKSEARQM